MSQSVRALAVLALGLCTYCGGAVDAGSPSGDLDAATDTSCTPGTPACPAPDAGSAGADAGTAPGDAGDAGDALHTDGDSDAGSCSVLDGATWLCDPVAQCGCAPGQACHFNSGIVSGPEGTFCGASGSVGPYFHCIEDEDCEPGSSCVWDACRRTCASSTDCDGVDPYRKCIFTGSPPNTTAFGYCLALCDPVDPSSALGDFVPCGPGFQCQPTPPQLAPEGQTACSNYSDEPRPGTGEPCTGDSKCEPGHACEPAPNDGGDSGAALYGFCRRWCYDASDCGGAPCIPSGLYAGKSEFGLCWP